jgi:3D (Asp-Asp-Asp) domain-containing protein
MQPRSIVMALLTMALVLFTGGHHTSEAELNGQAVKVAQVPAQAPHISSRTSDMQSQHTMPTHAVAQHKIQSGDTLSAIAARYNTKIEDIVNRNPAIKPENLSVGQVLQVPLNTVKKAKTRAELAKEAAQTVFSSSGAPSSFVKKVPCILTAYSNSFESTGKNPGDTGYGITASGQVAKEGWTVAVDPAMFPLHSILYIPGIGFRYAEDTGGAVKGSHIDVFYGDDGTCRQFGVKGPVNVYLIQEGSRES